MSGIDAEQSPSPTLTEQVLQGCREAYDTLRGLREWLPREGDPDKTPEAESLGLVIGSFVAANSTALADIGAVPRTPVLQEAASVWLEARLRRKLLSAMFSEQLKQKTAVLTELLAGYTIKARSLRHGFTVIDGYSAYSGGSSPKQVTEPFLSINPAGGNILVGTLDRAYRIDLYYYRDPSQPASIIEVI